jgi:predicted MFS family arabinose efflux permease
MNHEGRPPAEPGPLSLWGNRRFLLLWGGETVSKVGTAVSGVALPLLAALTLHVSAFEIGLITAAQWVPWLVIGLPAGAWVDRWSPWRVMIGCDIVSAAAMASIPAAEAAGALTIAHIVAAVVVLGVSNVFFSTAYVVYAPLVVERDQLVAANSRLQGSESVAQVLGPSLGGLLAQAFGAATGLLADGLSFVVSAIGLGVAGEAARSPDARKPQGGRDQPIWREVRDGIQYVLLHRLLGLLTIVAALANLTIMAYEAIVVLFLLRTVHLAPVTVGLLMAATGIGGIAGAFLAGPVVRWLGETRAVWLSLAAAAPFGLLIPLTASGPPLALFVVGGIVPVAGFVVFNVIVGSYRQASTPAHLLGRVSASTRFLMFGAIPLGAVIGGALGSLLGLRAALWYVMAAALIPGLLLTLSPIPRARDLSQAAASMGAPDSAGPSGRDS